VDVASRLARRITALHFPRLINRWQQRIIFRHEIPMAHWRLVSTALWCMPPIARQTIWRPRCGYAYVLNYGSNLPMWGRRAGRLMLWVRVSWSAWMGEWLVLDRSSMGQ
jgi:hypothetical protein